MGACAAGGACCCAIFTVSFPLASHLTENCGRQRLSQSRGVLVLVSWLGSEYGRLRLRGLRQQVIRAVLRHAREDLGRAHRLDRGLDRRRGELDPSFDPSFRDLPRQPLASEGSLMRRPSVDALAPALHQRRRRCPRRRDRDPRPPIRHWMQPPVSFRLVPSFTYINAIARPTAARGHPTGTHSHTRRKSVPKHYYERGTVGCGH
mmetsp:Transcript_30925/g.90567  ORF Transcript_30925/g.90567 Transcript_30925/m.90567 type:complete len:205 (+) Transcript_30925:1454-2068(+)